MCKVPGVCDGGVKKYQVPGAFGSRYGVGGPHLPHAPRLVGVGAPSAPGWMGAGVWGMKARD